MGPEECESGATITFSFRFNQRPSQADYIALFVEQDTEGKFPMASYMLSDKQEDENEFTAPFLTGTYRAMLKHMDAETYHDYGASPFRVLLAELCEALDK